MNLNWLLKSFLFLLFSSFIPPSDRVYSYTSNVSSLASALVHQINHILFQSEPNETIFRRYVIELNFQTCPPYTTTIICASLSISNISFFLNFKFFLNPAEFRNKQYFLSDKILNRTKWWIVIRSFVHQVSSDKKCSHPAWLTLLIITGCFKIGFCRYLTWLIYLILCIRFGVKYPYCQLFFLETFTNTLLIA